MKILLQFDKAVNNSLANRVKSKITFKVTRILHIIIIVVYMYGFKTLILFSYLFVLI